MDKKKRKVYTPAEKRRRNRRHNAIVTSIAVVLMLAGIIIIVSDTTFFFDDAGRWIRRNIFGEVFETIPPFPTGRFRRTKHPCPKMLRKNRSFTIMRPNAFIFRNMI